jgi:hypothetical protein
MSDSMNQDTNSRLISAGEVEGTAVYDRAGEKLGTVKDVYLDKQTGQAEFASMAFGGVLGMGEKYTPLPWSELEYDTQLNGFVVDRDKETLERAPSYAVDRLAQRDLGWSSEVSGYYAGLGTP